MITRNLISWWTDHLNTLVVRILNDCCSLNIRFCFERAFPANTTLYSIIENFCLSNTSMFSGQACSFSLNRPLGVSGTITARTPDLFIIIAIAPPPFLAGAIIRYGKWKTPGRWWCLPHRAADRIYSLLDLHENSVRDRHLNVRVFSCETAEPFVTVGTGMKKKRFFMQKRFVLTTTL